MKLCRLALFSASIFAAGLICVPASAAIVASGFFSGTLERFDPVTNVQSTFATIASADDPFPGLSGVAFDRVRNRYAVSARVSSRVYIVDGTSGQIRSFRQLPSGTFPASVIFGPNDSIFVAANGSNDVLRLNANGTTTTFTLPLIPTGPAPGTGLPAPTLGPNLPSGLAFDQGGDLIVSSFAGGGTFRLNTTTGVAIPIGGSPLGNGQIAINDANVAFTGGAAFSNAIASLDLTTGLANPEFITVDSEILPLPDSVFVSPNFTSPSGIAIDEDGNFIVAALGRTNPTSAGDNFQNNGGLFRFSADGRLLDTIALNTTPFSSVVVAVAIPEPGSMAALAVVCIIGAAVQRKRYHARRKAAANVG